ncbi:hypothetical protein [Stakelama saccharophila]|uniref:HTH marR-type domain-containing protein n=1 Tax=Stakelama saccharophila TaxID=3075605 RepID=A0ABZ0B866_9SPHN|nr:hypothetical protein [Stakelama sp. W311]WNO53578.1 hypothetical protein RPR59_14245 [Stakelama sp. W311]
MADQAGTALRTTPAVIVITDEEAALRTAREAATLAGARILAACDFAGARERLAMQVGADIILIEAAGIGQALLDDAMEAATLFARECGARLVATFARDQIDAVAACLLGSDVQLLCDPSMAERVGALAVAARGGPGGVREGADEEIARLQRINAEVARIAETLARLTRSDATGPDRGVRDRETGYGAPPPLPPPRRVDAGTVRAVIRLRRLRDRFFDPELFADPAWDMLLDLYAAAIERVGVSVSSLCIAASVPPTTALRWIKTMTDTGLFERRADPHDRRRAFIVLGERAEAAMGRYFAAAADAGLALG